MSTTPQRETLTQRLERKLATYQQRRENIMTRPPSGARDAAAVASTLSYLDGKIDILEDTLEFVRGE